MNKYCEAIKHGQQLAQESIEKRQQIEQVFLELSQAVEDASHGKLSIAIKVRALPNTFIEDENLVRHQATYKAIVIEFVDANGRKAIEIARWRTAPTGYPCYIEFEDETITCNTKDELEHGLQKLIGIEFVGAILHSSCRIL